MKNWELTIGSVGECWDVRIGLGDGLMCLIWVKVDRLDGFEGNESGLGVIL